MHVTRFLSPGPGLEQYVRFYVQREARLYGTTVVHPVPARAAPVLEFMFGDPCAVRRTGRSGIEVSPRVVVVGLQTHRRVQLLIRGTVEEFAIFFQPSALHRLFSLPMDEMTNRDFEARAVFGPWITQLEQRLSDCGSFSERARIADESLLRRSLAAGCADSVSAAASGVLFNSGQVRISGLARSAGLSMRQFERRFVQQVGLPPKLYARIARFEAALESKAKSIARSWTAVAHDFGYHDQMHMIHDFAELSGDTPTSLLAQLKTVHEAHVEAARSSRTPAATTALPRLIL
jgi:AraC-like DNA-binding protein